MKTALLKIARSVIREFLLQHQEGTALRLHRYSLEDDTFYKTFDMLPMFIDNSPTQNARIYRMCEIRQFLFARFWKYSRWKPKVECLAAAYGDEKRAIAEVMNEMSDFQEVFYRKLLHRILLSQYYRVFPTMTNLSTVEAAENIYI